MARGVTGIMPPYTRPLARDVQSDYSGGLNTTADDSQLAPNQVVLATNSRLSLFGGIEKRGGMARAMQNITGTPEVRGLFAWQSTAFSGNQLIVSVANGHVWVTPYMNVPPAWTDLGAGIDATVFPSFAAFTTAATDTLYIADGGPLNSTDGAALTLNIAGTPNVAQLAVYNQRLFGISGMDESLHWSALNDGSTLGNVGAGGGEAIIRTFADNQIIALAALKSSLLIFHQGGISRFTGISQDDIAIAAGTQGVSGDVGTVFPRSIVVVENVCYFLSDRGMYMATEFGVEPISTQLDATIRAFNFAAVGTNLIIGVHDRAYREVWFYFYGLGVLAYNYALKSWSGPYTGAFVVTAYATGAWSMCAAFNTVSARWVVLMGNNKGAVMKCDQSTCQDFDGNVSIPYTMSVQCRRFYQGDIPSLKSMRFAYVTGELNGSTVANLAYAVGASTDNVTLTTGSGGSGEQTYRIPMGYQGTFVDATFTDASTNQVHLSSVEVQGMVMGRRY